MTRHLRAWLTAFTLLSLAACGDAETKKLDDIPYGRWVKIEPAGRVCSDGSQYKFFVNLMKGSEDVMIMLEPGGACWDYESCSGAAGIRGAANPNGIPDDHMDFWQVASPLIRRRDVGGPSPTGAYNLVFVPYCTGDIHAGNAVKEYEGPAGEKLTFHHKGAENVRSVGEWVSERFDGDVDTLFVTGCSAGGAGTIGNYYFLRQMFGRVGRGVMLDDAGPIFPDSAYSGPLHAKVRESWDVDSLFEGLPGDYVDRLADDLGNINALLAEEFPDDRLANTYFRLDYNYSLYSYERFYEDSLLLPSLAPDEYRKQVYEMWWEDTKGLLALSDEYDNLGYYIPFYRAFNDSHCATVLGWDGTEMEIDGLETDLLDYVEELLHGEGPVPSHVESVPEGEYMDLAPNEAWPPL